MIFFLKNILKVFSNVFKYIVKVFSLCIYQFICQKVLCICISLLYSHCILYLYLYLNTLGEYFAQV